MKSTLFLLLYAGMSALAVSANYYQLQRLLESSGIAMLVMVTLVAALLTPLYVLNRHD